MVLGMDFIVNLLNRCVWGMGRLTLNKREASRYDIDRDILVTKVTAGRSNDLVDSDRCDFRWRMPPTCLVSMLSSHQRLHFIYDSIQLSSGLVIDSTAFTIDHSRNFRWPGTRIWIIYLKNTFENVVWGKFGHFTTCTVGKGNIIPPIWY